VVCPLGVGQPAADDAVPRAPAGTARREPGAISKELVAKLLAWRHPGFSAHVGERIAPEDKQRLLDTAAYLVRNPLSLKKLPFLGRNFEALDPLDWLARMSDDIVRPRTAPHAVLRRVLESGPE